MIKTVAILGSGAMGSDIAILFALNEFSVTVWHRKSKKIAQDRLLIKISKYVDRKILTIDQQRKVQKNLLYSDSLEELSKFDFIIESICEDFNEKVKLLEKVSLSCNLKTIIATNTSSMSITELKNAIVKNQVFLGLHFFNPVLRMDLIELIVPSGIKFKIVEIVKKLCKSVSKEIVEVKDSPGFLVNRIMTIQINQSITLLEEGVASKEDIDKSVTLGLLHPMGPISLADYIGLDVLYEILSKIFRQTGNPAYSPAALLKDLVEQGKLGRKSGVGFYDYS